MHDVVVIGASVAGTAVAIHLARAGRDVLLIDGADFRRRKPCGEGLFPLGVAALAELGVLDALAGRYAVLRGVRFNAGRHHAIAPTGDAPCPTIGIRREHLDGALREVAQRAGVQLRTGVTATGFDVEHGRIAALHTNRGRLPARAFVAADGLHSRLRRLAGLERPVQRDRYGVTAHVRVVAALEPLVDVTFARGHESYITPVGAHEANVAMLLRRPLMRRFAGDVETAFRQMVAGHPALRRGYELLDAPMVAGPFPVAARRSWRGNLVLAGDAAGFFDGISGEGMSVALATAPDCATAVDAWLASGSSAPLRTYDRQRRAAVRNSNLLARVSLALGGRPRLARLAVRNLSRQPATFARLVAIHSGQAGLTALRPRDLPALLAGL